VAAESGSLLTAASSELLVTVAAVAGALSMIYLVDLHRFAKKVRVIADRILDEIPEREYYLGKPRARDRHHVFYLGVKFVIIAASTTLAAIALA
jgi:hypothetical protein